MALEAIGFGLTVAAFAKALPEILKCAQDILESKQNSYELKRQKRKFDRYVSKVEAELRYLLKTRSRPVPRDLLRASLALVKYCKDRIIKAETFYKRFEADPWTFRFITHMARVFGKDKIRLLKRRLGEGEDWLRIALAAVALHGNFELAREDIETRGQCRERAEQLRYDLEKAQRYRKDYPARMKHMNKARVDYRCIASHAYAIANHPMFEGSELSSSSMTFSTSPSGESCMDPGTHVPNSTPRNMYHRTAVSVQQGLGEYPVSEIPEASGAPLETWVNARYEPAWVHDLYYDPPTGESRHISALWSAPLRYGWLPQTAQGPIPDGPSTTAAAAAAAAAGGSKQRKHVRVVNVHPGQADQNGIYRPAHSVRVYQAPRRAVPSPRSDSECSATSRSVPTRSQGVRTSPQQQAAPLRHREASVSPSRSSHAILDPEMLDAVDISRRGEFHTTRTSQDGGYDPVPSQPIIINPHPQGRHHRPDQIPAPKTKDSPNARKTPYIHVESRSSSRSGSSSRTGSSPSTTFSRARGRPSSVSSSPATSFSIPSTGSTRDSGYSSSGSVCEPDVDKQSQQRPGDSHYPPNSHETRRGGYDAMQERRRSRRERGR